MPETIWLCANKTIHFFIAVLEAILLCGNKWALACLKSYLQTICLQIIYI